MTDRPTNQQAKQPTTDGHEGSLRRYTSMAIREHAAGVTVICDDGNIVSERRGKKEEVYDANHAWINIRFLKPPPDLEIIKFTTHAVLGNRKNHRYIL